MENGTSSRKGWEIAKDLIQFIIIPMLFLVYVAINNDMEKTSNFLKEMKETQLMMVSTVHGIQTDQQNHLIQAARDTAERARFHHVNNRNCIECKVPHIQSEQFIPKSEHFLMQEYRNKDK